MSVALYAIDLLDILPPRRFTEASRTMPFLWLMIIVAGLMLAELVTRKRRDVNALLRWARQNEATVMRVEPCLSPKLIQSRSSTNYIVRHQDTADNVYESVFEVGIFGTVEKLKTDKLSQALVRGMYDVSTRMDCRKCGSLIRPTSKRCAYCNAARDVFKFS